jgi:hypothetical protein
LLESVYGISVKEMKKTKEWDEKVYGKELMERLDQGEAILTALLEGRPIASVEDNLKTEADTYVGV